MNKKLPIVLGISGFLLCFTFLTVFSVFLWGKHEYNTLVAQSEAINSKWSQVLNVYQRRYDLIPNLVATVKGAANFEKDTFIGVADARASVGRVTISSSQAPESAEQLKQVQAAQGNISQALSRLMMITENYPQLQANQNFLNLQVQLEGTENRISVERLTFNKSVQTYNTHIKTFPSNFIAEWFNFEEKPYFENESASNVAPKVSFE